MHIAKVKEKPGLVRDLNNQAVLSTDNSALESYRKKRDNQREVKNAVDDINNMKQDINELKTLMQRILEKIG